MRHLRFLPAQIAVLGLVGIGCQPEFESSFTELELFVLSDMQRPVDAPLDETNEWDGNPEAIEFGKQLFFNHSLSPNAIACSSCHVPNLGFSDGLTQSFGADVTPRHSPTLFDVAQHTWFRWDGGCDSLWCQAIGPIESPKEMNGSRTFLVSAISGNPDLTSQYEALFGELPDVSEVNLIARPSADDTAANEEWNRLPETVQHDITEVLVNVVKSIAAYEATIQSQPTVFDDFVTAMVDPSTTEEAALTLLSPEEEQGLRLFLGEGQCHLCHNGPTFSNDGFHNIGLGPRDWLEETDIGRYDGITMVQESEFNAAGPWSSNTDGYRASRVERLVQSTEQLAQFKTPSLRNLFQTAPYMHGGHFDTLEEVLQHYSELEESTLQGHSDEVLAPLNWTTAEKEAMIAFLRILDDSQ